MLRPPSAPTWSRRSPTLGGQEQLPGWIPFWYLGRNYTVTFTARTADGSVATTSLPVRLER